MWEKGDLKLLFHGHKLAGEFALVRTNRSKGKDWLLIKKKDFAVRPAGTRNPTLAACSSFCRYLFHRRRDQEPHAGDDRANAGYA